MATTGKITKKPLAPTLFDNLPAEKVENFLIQPGDVVYDSYNIALFKFEQVLIAKLEERHKQPIKREGCTLRKAFFSGDRYVYIAERAH